MMEQHDEQHLSKQGRIVALVIAGSMLFWIAAQYIGPRIGLSGRFAILIDLLVLAALFWAMVVTAQIWRKRQANKG
ncbi:MAG: DUF5337 domain-containing protein [Paracoccaceae bacterium]